MDRRKSEEIYENGIEMNENYERATEREVVLKRRGKKNKGVKAFCFAFV